MRERALIYLLIILSLSLSVSAFGISYPYMPNDTLNLYAGQGYLFKLIIQNKDPEGLRVKVGLNSTIADIVGDPELNIPGQTFDRHIYFNITVPINAQIGDTYNINYGVFPIDSGKGQIPLVVSYDRNFKVKVGERPAELRVPQAEQPQELEQPGKKSLLIKLAFIPIILIVILIVVVIWRKSQQASETIMGERQKQEKQELKPPMPKLAVIVEHRTIPIEPPVQQRLAKEPEETEEQHELPAQEAVGAKIPAPRREERILRLQEYFHLHNGKDLKNLEDLYYALKYMDDETFKHHVNPARNDFATWAAHSLEMTELAGKLLTASTPEEMRELIKNEIQ